MTIIHDKLNHQFLFVTEQNIPVGKLFYRFISEYKIEVFSTQVEKIFQGKGIAGELYNALIEFAIQQQLKIKPSCSYIEAKMVRNHVNLIG